MKLSSAAVVSSWLASKSTSPVDMSTTSATDMAPSRSLEATSTRSIFAFWISFSKALVMRLPAARICSPERETTGWESRMLTRPGETFQNSFFSRIEILSTL